MCVVLASEGYPGSYEKARSSSESTRPSRSRASRCSMPAPQEFRRRAGHCGRPRAERGGAGRLVRRRAREGVRSVRSYQLRRQAVPQRHRQTRCGRSCRLGELNAFRTLAHVRCSRMHEELPAPRTDARATRARAEARPEVHAVHARPFLRAPVPVLQLQPLPLSRGGRPALLREHAQRDADVEGPRLRLREHLRRRRHTHRHDRRAVRDARHGSRQLQHQGGRLRDQPEPSDAAVVGTSCRVVCSV